MKRPIIVFLLLCYGCKIVKSDDTSPVDCTLFKVRTEDASESSGYKDNDITKYTIEHKGLLNNQLLYKFQSGTKFVALLYNDLFVWKHSGDQQDHKFPSELEIDPYNNTLWIKYGDMDFLTFKFENNKWKHSQDLSYGDGKLVTIPDYNATSVFSTPASPTPTPESPNPTSESPTATSASYLESPTPVPSTPASYPESPTATPASPTPTTESLPTTTESLPTTPASPTTVSPNPTSASSEAKKAEEAEEPDLAGLKLYKQDANNAEKEMEAGDYFIVKIIDSANGTFNNVVIDKNVKLVKIKYDNGDIWKHEPVENTDKYPKYVSVNAESNHVRVFVEQGLKFDFEYDSTQNKYLTEAERIEKHRKQAEERKIKDQETEEQIRLQREEEILREQEIERQEQESQREAERKKQEELRKKEEEERRKLLDKQASESEQMYEKMLSYADEKGIEVVECDFDKYLTGQVRTPQDNFVHDWMLKAVAELLVNAKLQLDAKLEFATIKNFYAFCKKNSRVLFTIKQFKDSYTNFRINAVTIEAHNKNQNRLYNMAYNTFADMGRDMSLMSIPTTFNETDYVAGFPTFSNTLENQQIDVDWRKDGKVSRVITQGKCALCWGIPPVDAFNSFAAIKNNTGVPYSIQQILDCVSPEYTCVSGGSFIKVLEYIKDHKMCTYQEYPYVQEKTECQAQKCQHESGITSIRRLNANTALDFLKNKGPFVAMFYTTFDFFLYGGEIYDGPMEGTRVHSVLVVGHGHDTVKNVKYWIAKNSWGETWGEDGYFRILDDSGHRTATFLAHAHGIE